MKLVVLLKKKKHLLVEQDTKEIKEDFSIVKLNICNLRKAVIMRLKSTETLENHLFSTYSN